MSSQQSNSQWSTFDSSVGDFITPKIAMNTNYIIVIQYSMMMMASEL